MAEIHNSDLKRAIIDGAKIQLSRDDIPHQLADKVVPVMEVNPELLRTCNISFGSSLYTSGLQTVFTTPEDKDFYLTNLQLHMIKNDVCDAASGRLQIAVVIGGETVDLANISMITLTAQSEMLALTFPKPIKLDRGTIISCYVTYALGTMTRAGAIQGYTVED